MKTAVLMIGHIKNSLDIRNYLQLNKFFNQINCDLFVFTSKKYTFRKIVTYNERHILHSPDVDLSTFTKIYQKFLKKIIVEEFESHFY